MRPQRGILTFFLIHAVVSNLYYYDLLGEANKGSKSEKISNELHIFMSFTTCSLYNVNEFLFTVCLMAPAFIIAITF
jgi:hypothetical protein